MLVGICCIYIFLTALVFMWPEFVSEKSTDIGKEIELDMDINDANPSFQVH
jgi:hypothetical protein